MRYEGQFIHSVQHGQGKLSLAQGGEYDGLFYQGQAVCTVEQMDIYKESIILSLSSSSGRSSGSADSGVGGQNRDHLGVTDVKWPIYRSTGWTHSNTITTTTTSTNITDVSQSQSHSSGGGVYKGDRGDKGQGGRKGVLLKAPAVFSSVYEYRGALLDCSEQVGHIAYVWNRKKGEYHALPCGEHIDRFSMEDEDGDGDGDGDEDGLSVVGR